MQSDGNSFCGDFVLNSVHMANMDEESILFIYEKKIFLDLYSKDFEI